MKTKEQNIVIDIVFTWVDGEDEEHKKKMRPFHTEKNTWENIKFRTRYKQVNEIEYAIRSIIKFATFVKTIYIVTDNQEPAFLKEYNENKESTHPTIKIIDHKEIFVDHTKFLPVFNSMSIETLLYKIKGLSEHFIYFNDDCILLKKTSVSDFFQNGIPIQRGKWTITDNVNIIKKTNNLILKLLGKPTKDKVFGYKRVQQNAASLLGYKKKYFRIDHTPAPMRKSTLEHYFKEYPNIELLNMHRFRDSKQYLVQSLINHIDIKNNTSHIKNSFQLLFFSGSYKYPLFWYKRKLNKAKNNNNIIFLCAQSLDKSPSKIRNFILNWLDENLS